jgi:hypothetical protein
MLKYFRLAREEGFVMAFRIWRLYMLFRCSRLLRVPVIIAPEFNQLLLLPTHD